jgi:hypothetical protein
MEETARAAVLRLGPLAGLARVYVLGDVNVLSHAEGEVANKRPSLGQAKVPPERPVVALAEHLRRQTSPSWNAQPVCSALFPTVQHATPHQNRPAGWGV